jgi:flagellar basal body-associated protein FliL
MLSRHDSHVWLNLAALSLGICTGTTLLGCSASEEKSPGSLEAAEILELINESQERSDPLEDVEVDLGKFRVTHAVESGDEVLLLIDFQLFAVVSSHKQAALEAALPAYSNRLRDMVISLLQKIDTEHLTDPSLAFLRAELIAGLNRVLQQRLVKDVAFTDFSVHDAHQAPFPTTTGGGEKPKKSGHGGHGGGHGH